MSKIWKIMEEYGNKKRRKIEYEKKSNQYVTLCSYGDWHTGWMWFG